MKSKYLIIITVMFVAGLYSCLDDKWDLDKINSDISWQPQIAGPLVYGNLSLDDLLNKLDTTEYVRRFDDELLYITYSENLMSYEASDIIDIPDQSFLELYISSDVVIPEWLASELNDTISFHKQKDGEFIFRNNERLDSINMKTSILHIHVESSFKHLGILHIYSDNVLIDGEPFREIVQISDASGNFSYDVDIPIDGSIIMLDNTNPDTTILPLMFDLDLINSGAAIDPSERCNITMAFLDNTFNSVFGYLGDHDLLLESNEINVGLFDNSIEGGKLLFADPRLNLSIDNSYGVPVSIMLNDVRTHSSEDNITFPVTFNGVNPFDIAAPGTSEVGQTKQTFIEINKDNCNIVDALESQPEKFYFSVNAITNPDGPDVSNFITDTSNMEVKLEVILPLWVRAEGFTLERTDSLDFEENFGDNSDYIEYLRLDLEGTNYIPLQANLQLYFKDENMQIVDSLFHDDILLLQGAGLDDEDKVSVPFNEEKSVELTRERLEKMQTVKFYTISASVNTTDSDLEKFVKFYSYYTIDFKLKVTTDLNINSGDL